VNIGTEPHSKVLDRIQLCHEAQKPAEDIEQYSFQCGLSLAQGVRQTHKCEATRELAERTGYRLVAPRLEIEK